MAAISSSISPLELTGLSGFDVLNQTLTLANTEYSVVLPTGIKNFSMQNRGDATLKVSGTMGNSGTTYMTMFPGKVYNIENINSPSAVTLYVQSTKANQIIEIAYWT